MIKKLFLCIVSKPRVEPINSKHNNFKGGTIFAGICTLVISMEAPDEPTNVRLECKKNYSLGPECFVQLWTFGNLKFQLFNFKNVETALYFIFFRPLSCTVSGKKGKTASNNSQNTKILSKTVKDIIKLVITLKLC